VPNRIWKSFFASAITLSVGAGGVVASDLEWQPLEGSQGTGIFGDSYEKAVYALHVFDDGVNRDLCVGGTFDEAGGVPGTAGIARWDGENWSAFGFGLGGDVYAMETLVRDGNQVLIAGGSFGAGTTMPNTVALWDGESWLPIGRDLDGTVYALAQFDDGTGASLYAGGNFSIAGEDSGTNLARWNGEEWASVAGGLDGQIRSLHVFDDGSGPALFVGGNFTAIDGVAASGIARWDGMSWSALGQGIDGGNGNFAVLALTNFDDGSGDRLFVGGNFAMAGGAPASRIAAWDGTEWSAVGAGVDGSAYGVRAFAVQQTGNEPALYVGGTFFEAGSQFTRHLARWDGTAWSPEGPPFDRTIRALAVYGDADGSTLYAGGDFNFGCGKVFGRIARRGLRTDPPCDADLNRDGVVDLLDLNILLLRFEQSSNCGDTNGDGEVNLADLNMVLAAFGSTCPE
jgi:hypothetical protein